MKDYIMPANSKTQNPLVSVLMPVYNTNPEYLRTAIESILNQTFDDFEFLILNDSPENTKLEDLILSYKDKRIIYIKNKHNIGLSASRNKLIDLAQGEYLAVFDHDDISYPNRLEKQVAVLNNNPYIGVVGTWAKWFGNCNFIRKNPELDTDIKIRLTDVCAIMHTTAMIRKSVLIDNNIKYEEQYTPAEDYRLWTQLMDVTDFYNIQEALVDYRSFAENTSHTNHRKMQIAHESIKIQTCNKYPAYRKEFEKNIRRIRIRLFGKIPFLKIKNKWVLLFDFIPLFKMKD
jgi:glycosyltransferase involved in cell wall biosynthesis